jgi:hypothetical protein
LVNEYPDVFADKLLNKPPHPKAPQHRIILKDENKSINGRAFRIPECTSTRYWISSKSIWKLAEFIPQAAIYQLEPEWFPRRTGMHSLELSMIITLSMTILSSVNNRFIRQ